MSKNKQAIAVKADNQKRNKVLLIAIVCVVTALIIAASLIIALWPTEDKTVANLDNETIDTSSATITNGDFEYLTEADSTTFPKVAQSWTKYGYKAPTSKTSQGYTTLSVSDKTLMGVVDTASPWDKVVADLAGRFTSLASLNNPEARPGADGSNIYMIHNDVATTASIYSSSFYIGSTTSIKVTLWLKTVGVKSGEGAFVMIKQQSASALEQSSLGVQYWYAHKGVVDGSDAINTNETWQEYTFYVFNQTSSSKTVYINVGLGNVYTNEAVAGTLFIDDIVCDEEVTSNELRIAQYVDQGLEDPNTAYMIEGESNTNKISYVSNWTASAKASSAYSNVSEQSYLNSTKTDYPSASNGILPAFEFVTNNNAPSNYIHSITNNGSVNGGMYADTNASDILVKAPATAKQLLVSIWVRVKADNKQAVANVYLRSADGKDLSSFTEIQTSSDIDTDANNGWVKYSFYIQPSDAENNNLSVRVALGPINGYEPYVTSYPKATVYFTDLIVEEITQSQYASASASTYVKKYSLNGSKGSNSFVSNNTFSNYVTNSSGVNSASNLYQPTDWTPVYANSNEIYRDGRSDVTVNTKDAAINAGILLGSTVGPVNDDQTKGVLMIENKQSTSFGYLSSNISFAANSYYVLSVLAKTEGAGTPGVYLIDANATDKSNIVMQSYEGKVSGSEINGSEFFLDPSKTANDGATAAEGGWTRYYFVIATGDSAVSAKLALFNGKINATASSGTSTGTVYFDQATVYNIGTYTRPDATKRWEVDDDGEWVLDKNDDLIPTDEFNTVTDDFATYNPKAIFETYDQLVKKIADGSYGNVVYGNKLDTRFSDVTEPEITDDTDDSTDDDDTTDSTVDWALLVSIISSSLLVAALVIVVIVKYVFKKQPNNK